MYIIAYYSLLIAILQFLHFFEAPCSSLENILSVSIQYDYERITSGNIQNCCVRGHSLMTELIFHQISLSTRQRYILLDRMWNKAHKSVLYFTFCVIYFTLYPVLSTYSTGVYSLTIVLILYKRLKHLLEVILRQKCKHSGRE